MKNILLSLATALLLALSFPPHDLELFAWVAMAPLLLAIRGVRPGAAFSLAFVAGICSFMGVFYWINTIKGFTYRDFMILGVYLGGYFGIFGLLFGLIDERMRLPSALTAPALFVAMEYARSHAGFMQLPWALLGHSQYLDLVMVQIASFTGVFGVSFLVVMSGAALADAAERGVKAWKSLVLAALALGLSAVYGVSAVLETPGGETIKLTVIQGNIPQDVKWNPELIDRHFSKHLQLTEEAARLGPGSLIVWPESSVPMSFSQEPRKRELIMTLARNTATPLLLGVSQHPKIGPKDVKAGWHNSALLISSQGKIEKQYDKIRLLPFAEYLPYRDVIPWPSRLAEAAGHTVAGTEPVLFDLDGHKFAVLICWENIFPDVFHRFLRAGANFMVNITNEAWFGETAAPYQFLSMSVFRALEGRVSVVRAANTGISCFIDPYGRVTGRVNHLGKDVFVEGFLTGELPISRKKTFYTTHGDVFALACVIFSIALVGVSLLGRGRK